MRSRNDMKPSGAEWIGDIPSHWSIDRLKWSIASCRNGVWGAEPTGDGDDVVCVRVADFDRTKLAVRMSDPTMRSVPATAREGRSLFAGNLLIEKSGGGENQPVGIVVLYEHNEPAVCSNFVARIELGEGMVPSYWRYVHAAAYATRLTVRSINQTSGIQNLDQDCYFNELAPFPPRLEQTAIAAFLDLETAKIDALVEEQRQLIELLKEKRQAIISHAVTKGLNPNARMKPSGVEWLGAVPAHWKVLPIRYVARLESGHTPSRSRPEWWDNCTIPWFSLADIWQVREQGRSVITETSEMVSELGLTNSSARLLPKGTVMLSRTASVGFAAIMGVDMATTQDFANWVCGPDLDSEFLLWTFRAMRPEFERLMMGSTHNTIYMPDIASFRLALPPLNVQRQIASHLNVETANIDALTAEAAKLVTILQERRSALISAAVTGKIRVYQPSASAHATPEVRTLVATEAIERLAGKRTFGRVKLQKVIYLAEAHAGVSEIGGSYLRAAAGPLDRNLADAIDADLVRTGHISIERPEGPGSQVTYKVQGLNGLHRNDLMFVLGERAPRLDHIIDAVADLDTKATEAVATLYAVWNDFLLDRKQPTDAEIVSGVLNDWHPEKREKFRAEELDTWLGFMRRNKLTPSGNGPRTTLDRLFV